MPNLSRVLKVTHKTPPAFPLTSHTPTQDPLLLLFFPYHLYLRLNLYLRLGLGLRLDLGLRLQLQNRLLHRLPPLPFTLSLLPLPFPLLLSPLLVHLKPHGR